MGQPERGDALPILCEEPGAGYRAMSDYGKDSVLVSEDTGSRGNMDVQCVMALISVEAHR